jgi:hypothetical protein
MEGLGVKPLVFGENLKGEKKKMLTAASKWARDFQRLPTFPNSSCVNQ